MLLSKLEEIKLIMQQDLVVLASLSTQILKRWRLKVLIHLRYDLDVLASLSPKILKRLLLRVLIHLRYDYLLRSSRGCSWGCWSISGMNIYSSPQEVAAEVIDPSQVWFSCVGLINYSDTEEVAAEGVDPSQVWLSTQILKRLQLRVLIHLR